MKKIASFAVVFAAALILCAGESYSFFTISDTHFGYPENYAKPKPGAKGWYCRDTKRTVTALPVYKALFDDISSKADKDSFLIQCGDLIDGATLGLDVHKKEISTALELLDKHIKIKIYHVSGNHEDYGTGGKEAYEAVLLPAISAAAGQKLAYGNYTFAKGKDRFIVLDWRGRSKWTEFLKKILASLESKPRYLFVAIHTPIIAAGSASSLVALDLLLPYDAIVLSGHIHQNMIAVYKKNGHAVTQLTVSTRLPERSEGKIVCAPRKTPLEKYKETSAAREKKPACRANIEKLLADVTEYTSVSGVGYLKIDVSDAGVTAFYQGTDLAKKPAKFTILPRPEKTEAAR